MVNDRMSTGKATVIRRYGAGDGPQIRVESRRPLARVLELLEFLLQPGRGPEMPKSDLGEFATAIEAADLLH